MKTSPEDHDHASQCDIGLENSIAWVSCQTFPARGSWQVVLGKHAGDVKPDLHEVLADARACKFPETASPATRVLGGLCKETGGAPCVAACLPRMPCLEKGTSDEIRRKEVRKTKQKTDSSCSHEDL